MSRYLLVFFLGALFFWGGATYLDNRLDQIEESQKKHEEKISNLSAAVLYLRIQSEPKQYTIEGFI